MKPSFGTRLFCAFLYVGNPQYRGACYFAMCALRPVGCPDKQMTIPLRAARVVIDRSRSPSNSAWKEFWPTEPQPSNWEKALSGTCRQEAG